MKDIQPVGHVHINYQGAWASLIGNVKEGDPLYTPEAVAAAVAKEQSEKVGYMVAWERMCDAAQDQKNRIADLESQLAAARKGTVQMLGALNEINNWLVCGNIVTPEDMAQSFPHMQQIAEAAIRAAGGHHD